MKLASRRRSSVLMVSENMAGTNAPSDINAESISS
jgi:hypothetical protein